MTQTPVTIDRLRADIAAILEMTPDQIGDEANVMDLGLDSMRAMNLLLQWEDEGVPLDFADLAETPTLAGLWALVRERQEAREAAAH